MAVTNVFVLMLENHSFDNVFAYSHIPGLWVATSADTNVYDNVSYAVEPTAPASMPTDPGHAFLDVVEQLGGPTARWVAGKPYPAITNAGYVANYATSHDGRTAPDRGDVMKVFDTPNDLPVIYQLATEFAVCDQWFSSLPGPTWPNRFFVHGASSAGLDDSPTTLDLAEWETHIFGGFRYPNGSIYDALNAAQVKWRVFVDESGPIVGSIPQVCAIEGVSWFEDTSPFSSFASAVQDPNGYPYRYTFIEPNYGEVFDGTYRGGSSQHPMDGVAGGEALIKATYEAIRASSLWDTSLLIITYDEHGGFYDSGKPKAAPPPADNSPSTYNHHGFRFDHYGVRVPAVIVSPLIARGVVDHTVYDHASVLATAESLFGVGFLTERDKLAHDVVHLLGTTPRTDCPTTLNDPAPPAVAAPRAAAPLGEALPDDGNERAFLSIVHKTQLELAAEEPQAQAAARARFAAINTRTAAQAYTEDVYAQVRQARR